MWMRCTKPFNTPGKTIGKSKFGFERTAVSNFKSKRHVGSENEIVDHSRAPCLGADQKARGLWERDCTRKARDEQKDAQYVFFVLNTR